MSTLDTPRRPVVRTFSCPSCGSSITPIAEGWAVTIACSTCGAVLDALDPNHRVLQEHATRSYLSPAIPLGTRGTIEGVAYAVIGFQRVTITVEGTDYSWFEYTCFNPYHGFRWLSEYEGHWNVIEKVRTPIEVSRLGTTNVEHDGRSFRHFQSANARTTYAMGEFPWELRVGDPVMVRDYVAPPFILSSEGYGTERTWSLGRYTEPAEMAAMFKVPALNRAPRGVFANQPNPHTASARGVRRVWAGLMVALAAMLVATWMLSSRRTVLEESATFTRAQADANAVVFGPFELDGRTSNVRVSVNADVDNDWLWYGFSLIDEATGVARDFSAQTSYYSGRDSDGSWSEGSRNDRVTLGQVPAGRYLLRVAPEGDPVVGQPTLTYRVQVRRDVPSLVLFVLASFALTTPMLFAWWPSLGFETRRWAESDTSGGSSSSDEDDDD